MQRRVHPLPFEWAGIENAAQRSIVDGVHSHAVRLDVDGQAVRMSIRVAAPAGELPAKGDVGAMKQPLSPAYFADFGGPAEGDLGDRGEAVRVDHGYGIIQSVYDVGESSIGGERHPAGIASDGNFL